MKILKDSTYSLLSRATNLGIMMGGLVILARELTPAEFGVFAIVLAVQALFQPLLDMGLTPAFIKKESINKEFKSAFFSINIFLGMLNVLFLGISIPILNTVYDYENLGSLMFLFSISVVFTSLSLQGIAELTREKSFRSLFYINIGSVSVSTFIAVISAYMGFGIWSLAIKVVTASLTSFLIVIYFKKFSYQIVSMNIVKKYMSEIRFGFEIFINRLINGAFESLDKLLFVNIFGSHVVGNYSNASQISKIPDSIIRTSLTTVAYSHLERMTLVEKRSNYLKYYGSIFLFSSILPLVLISYGDVLVLFLLGNQWGLAAEYISTLGFFSLGMIIKGISTMFSMNENSMRYINKMNIISFSCLLVTIGVAYTTHDMEFTLKFFSYSFLLYWMLVAILIIKREVQDD